MAVRSRRVAGPTLVAAGATTLLYTVPAGRTLRMSVVSLVNVNAVATTATLKIGGSGGGSSVLNRTVAAVGDNPFTGGLVANPGDTIYLTAGAAGSVVVALFGSLLLGAPE